MGNVEHDRQRGHTIAGAVAPAGAPVLAAAVPVQEQESVEELRAARLRSIMQRHEQQAQPVPTAAAAAANEKGQGKDGEEDEDEDEDHEGLEDEVM